VSLPKFARLLGHSRVETTARSAHLARDLVHEAAARIAARIREYLLSGRVNGDASRAGRLSPMRPRSSQARARSYSHVSGQVADHDLRFILPMLGRS